MAGPRVPTKQGDTSRTPPRRSEVAASATPLRGASRARPKTGSPAREKCVICLSHRICAHVRGHACRTAPEQRCGPAPICLRCSDELVMKFHGGEEAGHGQFLCPICLAALGPRRRAFVEGPDAFRWLPEPDTPQAEWDRSGENAVQVALRERNVDELRRLMGKLCCDEAALSEEPTISCIEDKENARPCNTSPPGMKKRVTASVDRPQGDDGVLLVTPSRPLPLQQHCGQEQQQRPREQEQASRQQNQEKGEQLKQPPPGEKPQQQPPQPKHKPQQQQQQQLRHRKSGHRMMMAQRQKMRKSEIRLHQHLNESTDQLRQRLQRSYEIAQEKKRKKYLVVGAEDSGSKRNRSIQVEKTDKPKAKQDQMMQAFVATELHVERPDDPGGILDQHTDPKTKQCLGLHAVSKVNLHDDDDDAPLLVMSSKPEPQLRFSGDAAMAPNFVEQAMTSHSRDTISLHDAEHYKTRHVLRPQNICDAGRSESGISNNFECVGVQEGVILSDTQLKRNETGQKELGPGGQSISVDNGKINPLLVTDPTLSDYQSLTRNISGRCASASGIQLSSAQSQQPAPALNAVTPAATAEVAAMAIDQGAPRVPAAGASLSSLYAVSISKRVKAAEVPKKNNITADAAPVLQNAPATSILSPLVRKRSSAPGLALLQRLNMRGTAAASGKSDACEADVVQAKPPEACSLGRRLQAPAPAAWGACPPSHKAVASSSSQAPAPAAWDACPPSPKAVASSSFACPAVPRGHVNLAENSPKPGAMSDDGTPCKAHRRRGRRPRARPETATGPRSTQRGRPRRCEAYAEATPSLPERDEEVASAIPQRAEATTALPRQDEEASANSTPQAVATTSPPRWVEEAPASANTLQAEATMSPPRWDEEAPASASTQKAATSLPRWDEAASASATSQQAEGSSPRWDEEAPAGAAPRQAQSTTSPPHRGEKQKDDEEEQDPASVPLRQDPASPWSADDCSDGDLAHLLSQRLGQCPAEGDPEHPVLPGPVDSSPGAASTGSAASTAPLAVMIRARLQAAAAAGAAGAAQAAAALGPPKAWAVASPAQSPGLASASKFVSPARPPSPAPVPVRYSSEAMGGATSSQPAAKPRRHQDRQVEDLLQRRRYPSSKSSAGTMKQQVVKEQAPPKSTAAYYTEPSACSPKTATSPEGLQADEPWSPSKGLKCLVLSQQQQKEDAGPIVGVKQEPAPSPQPAAVCRQGKRKAAAELGSSSPVAKPRRRLRRQQQQQQQQQQLSAHQGVRQCSSAAAPSPARVPAAHPVAPGPALSPARVPAAHLVAPGPPPSPARAPAAHPVAAARAPCPAAVHPIAAAPAVCSAPDPAAPAQDSVTHPAARAPGLSAPAAAVRTLEEQPSLASSSCPSCGSIYIADSNFCRICGLKRQASPAQGGGRPRRPKRGSRSGRTERGGSSREDAVPTAACSDSTQPAMLTTLWLLKEAYFPRS